MDTCTFTFLSKYNDSKLYKTRIKEKVFNKRDFFSKNLNFSISNSKVSRYFANLLT